MMWQGFGVNNTHGIDGFPNGEAFRLGTDVPNGAITRLFVRQPIGLGGEQEDVADDQLTLAGKQDVSRLTFTLGRMSAKDIFDNNTYANDPRTQFMNWALMGNEAWVFSDVDYSTTLGVSVKGEPWHRPTDTFGLAGVLNGISRVHQKFLQAGGMGILAGDGNLSYGWEKIIETYYDFQIWKTVHTSLDYQFVSNPAFNRDRGPVHVFGARLHWEF